MDKQDLLSSKILLQIIEGLNEAIYVIDNKGTVVYVNKAAAILEQLTKEDMVGKTITEIDGYTEIRDEKDAPSLHVLKSGIPQIDENIEWFNKDGNSINAITSSYPIMHGDRIAGVFSISEHIQNAKKRLLSFGAFDRKNTCRIMKKKLRNGTTYIFDDIIAKSEIMQNTINTAKRFAAKKLPVMIYGETGTGKEMFAQSIHNASPNLAGPFVPINCAAIPENLLESTLFGTVKGAFTGATDNMGLFEKAEDGSIFLDEINSMSIVLQAKILRALQEKEIRRIGDNKTRKINCRIISATNKLPVEAFKHKELREDLFYRLSTGMLFIPPLRERGRDLDLLIRYFIEQSNEELDISIAHISEALKTLLHSYQWPGNIRELANTIESAMNLTQEGEEILDVQHLPSYLKKLFQEEIAKMPNAVHVYTYKHHKLDVYPTMNFHGNLSAIVGEYEKSLLELALASTRGNLTLCGQKLGITRQGLKKKLDKYKIKIEEYK